MPWGIGYFMGREKGFAAPQNRAQVTPGYTSVIRTRPFPARYPPECRSRAAPWRVLQYRGGNHRTVRLCLGR